MSTFLLECVNFQVMWVCLQRYKLGMFLFVILQNTGKQWIVCLMP